MRILLCFALVTGLNSARADDRVQFNRDIRPILSENCFACHGPDEHERKAKLRLDVADGGAFEDNEGVISIVPGKPDDSELVFRLLTDDMDDLMPPPETEKHLKPAEIALLKRWVAQGAEYQGHWSYQKPARPEIPSGANPIDHLVGKRLASEGLKPAPPAEPHTLLRRLSFDLTGLPPTQAEVAQFEKLAATDVAAAVHSASRHYIASPRHGERLATFWLDLVRYADSVGYHSDTPMNVYAYREWVVDAFNSNKPFDEFSREQLAGDLLPGATNEQKVASGYNRLLQTTEEGGAQAKEYIAIYAADRVRNISGAWLGGTLGCAQCHDHKFDPYTTRDFYSLAAFFADIKEPAVGKRGPGMALPTAEQAAKLKQLNTRIGELGKSATTATPQLLAAQTSWEQNAATAKPAPPKNILPILKIAAAKRNDKQKAELTKHYLTIAPSLAEVRKQLDTAKEEKNTLDKEIPKSLVSEAGKPREMRILPRGNWLDESGDVVTPAIPAFLGKLDNGDKRATRLDLANWIASPHNPLTARTFVNRLWKLFYGSGLSWDVDDLGSQGRWPSHPELLDWLSVEFVESGWDIRHMVDLMVNCSSYAQSSLSSPQLRERDPLNSLLARQSRFRLDAEMVRDNALALGGILVEKVGGPSAKPYQPAGYWRHLNFPARKYAHDTNENQYRRALYSHWQRSFLHPSLLAFDAPSREECTAARPRSNTPLQALVLLNDPTYVESARTFAERIVSNGGADAASRIRWAFAEALSRPPTSEELKLIADLQSEQLARYSADEKSAADLLTVGLKKSTTDIPATEFASWTTVARTILNLHETITRQ